MVEHEGRRAVPAAAPPESDQAAVVPAVLVGKVQIDLVESVDAASSTASCSCLDVPVAFLPEFGIDLAELGDAEVFENRLDGRFEFRPVSFFLAEFQEMRTAARKDFSSSQGCFAFLVGDLLVVGLPVAVLAAVALESAPIISVLRSKASAKALIDASRLMWVPHS